MKNDRAKKTKETEPEPQVVETTKTEDTSEVRKERRYGGGAFGAVVLVTIGIILLFNNLGLLPWEVWANLWKFWPVFLIIWGLQLVFGRGWAGNWLIALLGAVIVLGIVTLSVASVNEPFRNWSQERVPFWRYMQQMMDDDSREVTTRLEVLGDKYQGVSEREVKVEIGSAEFNVSDEPTEAFLRVVAIHPESGGKPRIRESFSGGKLKLDFDTTSVNGFRLFSFVRQEYSLFLGQPNLSTSVSLDLGSGTGTFDFNDLNIRDLRVNQGSGKLNINLQKSVPSGDLTIDLGSGNVDIEIPSDIGLLVDYNIGSGNLTIGDNRIRGDGSYTSQNFSTSTKKLNIKVELGSGNITINQ